MIMKNTIVVNLIGGQGAGKSTMMAGLFSWLKWNGVDCEMCTEFAKDLVWEGRKETFADQIYIFGKQNHKLFRCNGKVDVIITDVALPMYIAYNRFYGNRDYNFNIAYNSLVMAEFNNYYNLSIYINRKKPYNPNGRNETEEQAKQFDDLFLSVLNENYIHYYQFDGLESSIEEIGKIVLDRLSAMNSNWTEADKTLAQKLYNEGFRYIKRKDFGTISTFDSQDCFLRKKNYEMIEIKEFGKLKNKETVLLRDIINGQCPHFWYNLLKPLDFLYIIWYNIYRIGEKYNEIFRYIIFIFAHFNDNNYSNNYIFLCFDTNLFSNNIIFHSCDISNIYE